MTGTSEQPTGRPAAPPRLDSLTSARFLAAALVVLHHTAGTMPDPIGAVAHIGYVGVTFFFALSGFVLTWNASTSVPTRTFWRRRFARVWPLHLVMTVVAVLVYSDFHLGQLLLCLLLLQAWVPSSDWFYAANGPSWSLSAEAFFYALAPLLFVRRVASPLRALVGVLLGLAVLSLVAVVVVPPEDQEWALYVVPWAGLFAFVCGHLLARALRAGSLPRVPPALALAVVGALGTTAVLLSRAVFEDAGQPRGYGRGLIGALLLPGFLVVIVMLTQRDLAGLPTGLRGRWFVHLGEWSFALYLCHQPVRALLDKTGMADHPAAVTAVALSVVVSWALHVLVERPMERRLRGPHRVAAAAGRPRQ